MARQPWNLRSGGGRRLRTAVGLPLGALAGGTALCGLLCSASPAGAQSGPLFPEPFRVEHHVEVEEGGERFVGESVVDTYGDSWIVSERPDGSRLILDLARREATELRPATGTYSTISFGHLGEVARRAWQAQSRTGSSSDQPGANRPPEIATRAALDKSLSATPQPLVVVELAAPSTPGETAYRTASLSSGSHLGAAPALRRLQVTREDAVGSPTALENRAEIRVEVWVDPSLRLTAGALDALEQLEQELLSSAAVAETRAGDAGESPGRYLSAARRFAGGALAVRTARPLPIASVRSESAKAGSADRVARVASGQIVDVTTRLERLPRFPRELLEIPEGLRRVPHPLEATAHFLASEREDEELMSSDRSDRSDRAGRELVDGRPQ